MKLLLLTLTNAEGKVPERSDPARRCVGIFKAALSPSTGTASAWRIQPRDPPQPTPQPWKKPPGLKPTSSLFFFRGAGNGWHLPGCLGLLEEQGKLSKSGYFQNLSQSSSLGTSPAGGWWLGGPITLWVHSASCHAPKKWRSFGMLSPGPSIAAALTAAVTQNPWKQNRSFTARKSPGKLFFPPPLHKGKPPEAAPRHPGSNPDPGQFFFSQNNAHGRCLHTGGGCE